MAKCPVEGCTGNVRVGHLMCLGHWKVVSRKTQRDVNYTWKRYRQDPDAYTTARAAAIDEATRGDPAQDMLL